MKTSIDSSRAIGLTFRITLAVAAAALSACASATSDGPHEPPAESESATPTKQTAEPLPTTTASAAAASETSCMPLWVCGCNLGCASIGVASSQLHTGLRSKMLSGPEAGEMGLVIDAPKKGGGTIRVLSDRERSAACRVERPSPLIGFVCAAKDSGDVDPDACRSGCGQH